MRAGIGKPGSLIGLADGLAHEIGSDRLVVWRHAPHKHFATRTLWPLVLQICCDGMPGGLRQGQDLLASALGITQRERSRFPIDVVEREGGNFSAAKAKVYRAAHDRAT